MKAQKYSFNQTKKIGFGTKVIYKYPTPTRDLDIGVMVVNGRHPEDPQTFILEHECQFVMYVTKGSGKVYAGEELFDVQEKDVIFIPSLTKFAVEGILEYVTVDSPAFFPEQSEEIKV